MVTLMHTTNPVTTRETLCRIVEAAVLAPSAENLQPWQFLVEDDSLEVSLDRSRQLASDVDQMLGLTAIGTCIENAVVAASTEELRTDVDFLAESLPSRSTPEYLSIARLRFLDGGVPDSLAAFIESRCTSRRMDPRREVAEGILQELVQSCREFSDVTVHWVDAERLREFAELVGIGNRIRFEHRPFHEELYGSLRFTEGEVRRTRDGLDVATLQLPFGVANIMHVLRTWPRMKWANLVGFSRGVGRQATQEVIRSGAVGFLTVPAAELRYFVHGGRVLERLWLTATRLGICFHPTASLPVFLAHARTGGGQLLPEHRQTAEAMSERFYRLFPSLAGRTIQMAFRIGYGPEPPARTLRRPLNGVLDLH